MSDTPRHRIEALAGHHERSGFRSGSDDLDRYFRERVGQDQRRHVASCFVLVDSDTSEVLGYYTLSASTIVLSDLPDDLARRLPRYPNLPAILLGRLAIAHVHQGKGFGRRLLVDALERARRVSNQIAALAVVVDAKDEVAVEFYARYGFVSFASDARRLFLPIASIP